MIPGTYVAPGLDKLGAKVDRILAQWKRDNVARYSDKGKVK